MRALVMFALPLLALLISHHDQSFFTSTSCCAGGLGPQPGDGSGILRLGLPVETYETGQGMFRSYTLAVGIIGGHALAAQIISGERQSDVHGPGQGCRTPPPTRIGQHISA